MLWRNLLQAILVSLVLTTVAFAAAIYDEETVTVPETAVVDETLILTGESVTIFPPVDGDIISACRNLNLFGNISDNVFAACRSADIRGNANDLLVFAQTVNIKSDTTGDIRGAAQTYNIYGYVDGDVICAGESVFIGPSAVVTGDVFVGAGTLTVLGDVLGDVKGGMQFINIGGTVHGDVEAWTNEILFTGSGEVLGDLNYHRDEALEVDFSRNVRGQITFVEDLEHDFDHDKDGFNGFAFGFFLLLTAVVTTFLLLWIWRRGVEGSLVAMEQKTGMSIVAGLLGTIALPFVAIILLVMVITIPVGLLLLTLYPVLLYLGWIMFGIWLGKTLLDGLTRQTVSIWIAAPVGVLLVGILGYVPFVGFFIALVTTLIGMGMLIMQLLGLRTLRTW